MEVAVIGFGYWGSKVARAAVASFGVGKVVVVESSPSLRAEAARALPGVATASSLFDALLLPDAALIAAVVATPVATHESLALEAISYGLHVLVEKPISDSSASVIKIEKAAAEKSVRVGVGHTFLFSDRIRKLHTEITADGFGPVKYLTARRLNLGLHRPDVDVVWDLGPHDVSICSYLIGASATWVQATGVSGPDGRAETAFMTLGYPGDVVANLSISWRAPRKVRDLVLVGEGKMAIYDEGDDDEPIRVIDSGVAYDEGPEYASNRMTYRFGSTYAPAVRMREPLQVELTEFLSYANGTDPGFASPLRAGADVVRTLEAASLSMEREGQRITLNIGVQS